MISYSAAAWPSGLGAGLSRRTGGQGVGLTLDVAIFVFLGHLFLFIFCFFVHIFSLWLVSPYSHCWPFTASRDFCDHIFLVYVVTGVLARSPGSVFRYPPSHVFRNLCQEASAANSQFLPGVKLPWCRTEKLPVFQAKCQGERWNYGSISPQNVNLWR